MREDGKHGLEFWMGYDGDEPAETMPLEDEPASVWLTIAAVGVAFTLGVALGLAI